MDSETEQEGDAQVNKASLHLPPDSIASLCRKYHVRKLWLFGSALREDFGADSDVDVLVEFEPDHVPGLRFFTLQRELSEAIGRDVDLNTRQFPSPYFRDEVLAEAEMQYVAS